MNAKRPAIIEDNIFITEAIIHPHAYQQRKREPSESLSSPADHAMQPYWRLPIKGSLKSSLLAQLTSFSYILQHCRDLEKMPRASLYAEWLPAFTTVMAETLIAHARSIENNRGSIFSQFFERSHRVGALSMPAYPFDGHVDDLWALISTIAKIEENRNRTTSEQGCLNVYYMSHRSLGPVGSLAIQKLMRLGLTISSLFLIHCQLSDAHLLLLAKHMKQLKTLDVSDNEITNEGLSSLLRPFRYAASDPTPSPNSGLSMLEFLGLAGNLQIYSKTECLALFEFLPSLIEIDLSDTGLAKVPIIGFHNLPLYRRLHRSDILQTLFLSFHKKRSLEYQVDLNAKKWNLDSSLGPLSQSSLLHPVNYLLDMYIWHQYSTIAINDLSLPIPNAPLRASSLNERILRVSVGELKSRLKEEQAIQEKMNASKTGSWMCQRNTSSQNEKENGHILTTLLSNFKSASSELDPVLDMTFSSSPSQVVAEANMSGPSSSSRQFPSVLVDLKAMAATCGAQGSVGHTPIESVATIRSLESQLNASLEKTLIPDPRLPILLSSPSASSQLASKKQPTLKKQCTLSHFFIPK